MTAFWHRAGLFARIDALERHAATLVEVSADAGLRTEARALIDTLHRARAFIETAPPGPGLDDSQLVVESAGVLLASLDRTR